MSSGMARLVHDDAVDQPLDGRRDRGFAVGILLQKATRRDQNIDAMLGDLDTIDDRCASSLPLTPALRCGPLSLAAAQLDELVVRAIKQ
jgi:hypothetical protein